MIKKFKKILIANRGEIAIRIIKAAKNMGVVTVALYTNEETNALHVKCAHEAVSLGEGSLSETYLNIAKIIEIAEQTGAQAIHPGYGFLSENPEFARECRNKGIVFIGPSVDVLEKMGTKLTAKSIAHKVGVNVLSSHKVDIKNIEKEAGQIKYPVLIKASHGGGGKGMQLVHSSNELVEKALAASRSAQNYFGNGEIYFEDYIANTRHIEVQVLGDQYGNVVHLFERDCTVQRNHQKIIEEAPASCLSSNLRSEIHRAAIKICQEVAYENAGTVEFLLNENGQFFFLEMNPRIQVEHPVSEQVTGIDIVKEQLSIAAGNPLSFKQEEIRVNGHAIEVRIYAEDSLSNFAPSGKAVQYFHFPQNDHIRIETAIDSVSIGATQFDPLLCKLTVTEVDRENAITSLFKALDETVIIGPKTNQLYLSELINRKDFINNNISTNFCEIHHEDLIDGIRSSNEKFDKRFLVAVALNSFFKTIDNKVESVWNSIGYWRMFQSVDFIVNNINLKVSFEKKIKGLSIRYNKELFFAELIAISGNKIEIKIDNEVKKFIVFKENNAKIHIAYQALIYEVSITNILDYFPENYIIESELSNQDSDVVKSHLHGKIVQLNIKKDQIVNKGDVLLVIESMKSENIVISPKKAKVNKITVKPGTQVTDQMPLVYLEDL